jgi:hypothetical protein
MAQLHGVSYLSVRKCLTVCIHSYFHNYIIKSIHDLMHSYSIFADTNTLLLTTGTDLIKPLILHLNVINF